MPNIGVPGAPSHFLVASKGVRGVGSLIGGAVRLEVVNNSCHTH